MNTEQIENILRLAPKPAPPAGLKDQLIAQLRLPATSCGAVRTPRPTFKRADDLGGWLRRWWPVLAPATVSLACAAVLTVQQMEIRDLKQASQALSRDFAAKASALFAPTAQTNEAASEAVAAARTQQEIARLKVLASQLGAEVGQLEELSAENAKLRAQLAAPPAGLPKPEDAEAQAKGRACINNLKELVVAVRVWAIDNGDKSPPDILSMTNEIGDETKILVCPGDHGREAAKDWASYTSANCSYEYLAPSAPITAGPLGAAITGATRVLFRCPIHGDVGLVDGSVQVIAKSHPEQLVQRDGKLYYEPSAPPAQGAPEQPSGNPPPGGPNP
jgi:hypothetical protein